ncbi:hypothetical protein [Ralstonia sp.]|uniref:hypothetical protein n=1 Tax=Ralstonia sp. TaxID=54061 RepID=UPI0031DDCBE0
MNAARKDAEEFTSIAQWERKYLPNSAVLEVFDFDTVVIDSDVARSLVNELTREVHEVKKSRAQKRKL